jgi:hypothetical protein
MSKLLLLIMCHMFGDYVLQNDFIAKTKGENWYHLIVHSVLYSVPFLIFGLSYSLILLIISHIVIDALKARYNLLDYVKDQILHYIIILILYCL